MTTSVRPPGGQHHGAIAGQERLGGLAVDGQHPDGAELGDFECDDSAMAAIDEPQPDPRLGGQRQLRLELAVDCIQELGLAGIEARRDRGAVGLEPEVLDQENLVTVEACRRGLIDDQSQWPDRCRGTVGQQAQVEQSGAGARQPGRHGGATARTDRRLNGQRGRQSEATPGQRRRDLQSIRQSEIECSAALEPKHRGGSGQPPDLGRGAAGAQRYRFGPRLQRDRQALGCCREPRDRARQGCGKAAEQGPPAEPLGSRPHATKHC